MPHHGSQPACASAAARAGRRRIAPHACALLLILLALPAAASAAAPVLRGATIRVTFESSSRCVVNASFDVADPPRDGIEHRLQTVEGANVDLAGASAAAILVPPHPVGRTTAVRVGPEAETGVYALEYRVEQPAAHAYRCPLWLPTVPADGRSRPVNLRVALPAGASPAPGGFPSLQWESGEGTTTLGHVPAFVVVPFEAAGEARPAWTWGITRLMDGAALVLLALGMLAFAWRRKGR